VAKQPSARGSPEFRKATADITGELRGAQDMIEREARVAEAYGLASAPRPQAAPAAAPGAPRRHQAPGRRLRPRRPQPAAAPGAAEYEAAHPHHRSGTASQVSPP
jgi:hypothetical protein